MLSSGGGLPLPIAVHEQDVPRGHHQGHRPWGSLETVELPTLIDSPLIWVDPDAGHLYVATVAPEMMVAAAPGSSRA